MSLYFAPLKVRDWSQTCKKNRRNLVVGLQKGNDEAAGWRRVWSSPWSWWWWVVKTKGVSKRATIFLYTIRNPRVYSRYESNKFMMMKDDTCMTHDDDEWDDDEQEWKKKCRVSVVFFLSLAFSLFLHASSLWLSSLRNSKCTKYE